MWVWPKCMQKLTHLGLSTRFLVFFGKRACLKKNADTVYKVRSSTVYMYSIKNYYNILYVAHHVIAMKTICLQKKSLVNINDS